jgi:hypothetical protein
MSIFDLFRHDDPHKRDNVVLLFKLKTRTGDIEEKRVVVDRGRIQAECDALYERTDLDEAWVYQKIFHHKFPDGDEAADDTTALAIGLSSMAFRPKG